MRRWSLFLFPGALVCGVIAALDGRWLLALLSYVIAVTSTLNIVADLEPEGEWRPAATEAAQDVLVLHKPRRKMVRLASAGLAMKAGLVLTLPALAGAATGILPPTLQNWVADAVQRTVGLDFPGGRPADQRRGGTDLVEGVPQNGPVDPAPAAGPVPSEAPPPAASPDVAGAPTADQSGPPNVGSVTDPSEGGGQPSPPSPLLRVVREPDRIEIPSGPPPLPVTPVLPTIDPPLPDVGSGVGGNQSVPRVRNQRVPEAGNQRVPNQPGPKQSVPEAGNQRVPNQPGPKQSVPEAGNRRVPDKPVPEAGNRRVPNKSVPEARNRQRVPNKFVPEAGNRQRVPKVQSTVSSSRHVGRPMTKATTANALPSTAAPPSVPARGAAGTNPGLRLRRPALR